MSNWTELDENNLPKPHTLVWVERYSGEIYLAARTDKPISTNPAAWRDCHWYGKPMRQAESVELNMDWHPYTNFSDITIKRWAPLVVPGK